MYSEEEPELRDLIVQNLENCGFLNKIKAELRAGVFLALEEDGNLRDKIPLFNKKLDEYLNTPEGKVMLSLVREFLEFFNLSFTLSVFDPEVASSTPFISRSELCDNLKLKNAEISGPIISALLKDVIGDQMQNSISNATLESKTVPEKHLSISKDTVSEKIPMDNVLNRKNSDLNEQISLFQRNSIGDHTNKNSKEEIKDNSNNENERNLPKDVLSNVSIKPLTDIPEEANNNAKKDSQGNIFKEPKDVFSLDHDPFFDEPVPSEKTSFFSFSEPLKDKNETKSSTTILRDLEDSKKNSLSSLRDLPSLGANSWTFSRDSKDNQPSLDILKSFSVSEPIEKKENLEERGVLEKKDSDVTESNEESSEKQISEESIEEDIDEDFSAGMDDLLNSSLSLGDDITTDHTISQVSVVEGIDHVEPCNS